MARYSCSCSCGAIRCEIDHDLETVVNCHCTDCRKMNGSAFSSMVVSPESKGDITHGREHLGAYALSEAVTKHFCTRCGSPLFNLNTRLPGFRMLYLGAIDQHVDLVPSFNVFCRSQLGWVDRLADLKSYAGAPDLGD